MPNSAPLGRFCRVPRHSFFKIDSLPPPIFAMCGSEQTNAPLCDDLNTYDIPTSRQPTPRIDGVIVEAYELLLTYIGLSLRGDKRWGKISFKRFHATGSYWTRKPSQRVACRQEKARPDFR